MSTKRRQRRRARLWRIQKGRCHWCKQITRLPEHCTIGRGEALPDDLATIDHLDSRLSDERGTRPGEARTVMACWRCNFRRGAREVLALPLEELHRRSSGSRR